MGAGDLEGGFNLAYRDLDLHAVPTGKELQEWGQEVFARLPQRNQIAFQYSYAHENKGKFRLSSKGVAEVILGLVYYLDSLNAQYIMNVGAMRRAYKMGHYSEIKILAGSNGELKKKMKWAKGKLTSTSARRYFNKFRKWMHGGKSKISKEDYLYLRAPGPYEPSIHLRSLSMRPRSQRQIDAMLATYEKKHPGEPFPSDAAFAGLEAYKKFADAKMNKAHKPLRRRKRAINGRDLGALVAQIAETNPAAAAAVANAVASTPDDVDMVAATPEVRSPPDISRAAPSARAPRIDDEDAEILV